MSHGDRVEELPPNFIAICTTDNAPLAGWQMSHASFTACSFTPR